MRWNLFHLVWWLILLATATDVLLIWFNVHNELPEWKPRVFQIMGAAFLKALWLYYSAKKHDDEHPGK